MSDQDTFTGTSILVVFRAGNVSDSGTITVPTSCPATTTCDETLLAVRAAELGFVASIDTVSANPEGSTPSTVTLSGASVGGAGFEHAATSAVARTRARRRTMDRTLELISTGAAMWILECAHREVGGKRLMLPERSLAAPTRLSPFCPRMPWMRLTWRFSTHMQRRMSWAPFAVEEPIAVPRIARASRAIAYLAAALAVVVGTAALIGWAADVWWLRDPAGGFVPVRPNATVMFILGGASVGLSVPGTPPCRRLAKVLAALCAALALATLAQDVVGRDFGIDTLLFDVPAPRASPPGSAALVLTGAAVLVLDVRPRRGPAIAEVLALAVGTIGWLALGGFLYGATQFYMWSRPAQSGGIAINASVAIIALAIGIVAARPGSGAMALLTSRHVAGRVTRTVLPIALAMPVLGYFAVLAQRAGLYRAPGATVVEVVAGMGVGLVITLAVGWSLERTDARRRRTEAENREWKRFFDRATFGAVVGTCDGRLWRVNEAFARMHGCTAPELQGRPVADLFPPHRRPELAQAVRIADERGGYRWESEQVRKDGSVFPVVVDVSVVRDERGRNLYRAAYVQDITQEKEAEVARSRLASLVQSSEDAIVAKALDGTVLDWNRGAERVYGYSAEEMVGRSIDVIVPGDRRAEREELCAAALAGEVVVGVETERVRRDGRRIPVALTLSPIHDAAGRPIGFSTIERDISPLKQLEREREEWAAIVAHDLRQPACAIRLAAEILARTEGSDAAKKAVDRIRKASDRLERMVSDLLDASRIEARRLSVNAGPVDLPPLVAEVIPLVPGLEGRCRTRLAPDALHVWADAERVVQVLGNLLSNALKYGDPDTPVELCAERAGEMVRISVTNEGPGIAPDELPRLFSRFARTRSAQSGPATGLGLGLYICRGLVEAHGGELWAESIPGQQTHFRFTLRAAAERDSRAHAPMRRAS